MPIISRPLSYFYVLVERLQDGIPGFADLSKKHQMLMVRYIYKCGEWHSRHLNYEGNSYFTYQDLERDFGRGKFMPINENLNIFDVLPHNHPSAYTRGFSLSTRTDSILKGYLSADEGDPTKILKTNGRFQNTLGNSIASKDHHGANRKSWFGAQPIGYTFINRNVLLLLKDRVMNGETEYSSQEASYIIHQISLILRASETELLGPGYVIINYAESGSGRLYAQGTTLQNVPRIVRDAATHGKYDYDFENCHYTIFDQMAENAGYECERIRGYLADKEKVREDLAAYLDVKVDTIKACLIALMYGAKPNTFWRGAIVEKLAIDSEIVDVDNVGVEVKANRIGQQKARLLYEHPVFDGLVKDVHRAGPLIINSHSLSRARYKNAVGKGISAAEAERKIMAHLVQGVEVRALQVCLELYSDQIVLLLHDGFISNEKLDYRLIEEKILKEIGYKLPMSEKQIQSKSAA